MEETHDHSNQHEAEHTHPHEEGHIHPHDDAHTHPHEEGHSHPHDATHTHPHEDGHPHPHPHEEGHTHPHDNGHDHPHPHDHDHEHDHEHGSGLWAAVTHFLIPHSHTHYNSAQDAALASERGIWAVKISLLGLLVTAVFQIFIVIISGSVALLADTIHNFSDALTAIPLWLAFSLARRAANKRFTYGYGRAEDISGVIIVLMIFGSAVVAIYESVQKIIHPLPLDNLIWVGVASVIGFIGNELVAVFRIRVGREIGSAALVADGLHARTDGITSLGVLAGVIAVWLGFPIADPIVGILIGVAILGITWNAAVEIGRRIMDSIDPQIVDEIEHTARHVSGVLDVHDVCARWLGHRQRSEMHITVDAHISTLESHNIAEEVRHAVFHALPAMTDVVVHVDPQEQPGLDLHHLTAHHVPSREPARK